MELLLWFLIPIAAVFVIHYFEKKHGYRKEQFSAGLEIQSLWSVVVDNPNQVQELRSVFIDMERQLTADEFRFFGATKNQQLEKVNLNFLRI